MDFLILQKIPSRHRGIALAVNVMVEGFVPVGTNGFNFHTLIKTK